MGHERLDRDAIRMAYVDGVYSDQIICQVFGLKQSELEKLARSGRWRREDDEREDRPAVSAIPDVLDPLGDALERAGCRRFTVTTPCTDHPIYNWGLGR